MVNLIKKNDLQEGDFFFDVNGKNNLKGFGVGIVTKIFEDRDLFLVKFPHIELPWMFDQTFLRWDKSGRKGSKKGSTEKEILTLLTPRNLHNFFDKEIIEILKKENIPSLRFLFEPYNTIDIPFEGMREEGSAVEYDKFIIAEYEEREQRLAQLAYKIKDSIDEKFVLYDYKGYIITSSEKIIRILKTLSKNTGELFIHRDILLIDEEQIVVKKEDNYVLEKVKK